MKIPRIMSNELSKKIAGVVVAKRAADIANANLSSAQARLKRFLDKNMDL